jgi:hypothetical protein
LAHFFFYLLCIYPLFFSARCEQYPFYFKNYRIDFLVLYFFDFGYSPTYSSCLPATSIECSDSSHHHRHFKRGRWLHFPITLSRHCSSAIHHHYYILKYEIQKINAGLLCLVSDCRIKTCPIRSCKKAIAPPPFT